MQEKVTFSPIFVSNSPIFEYCLFSLKNSQPYRVSTIFLKKTIMKRKTIYIIIGVIVILAVCFPFYKKYNEELEFERMIARIDAENQPIKDSMSAIKAIEDAKKQLQIDSAFEVSKAGKIRKKHPEWSKSDCEMLADNQIWIGMHIDMVKYLRGLPTSVNPSNYGDGMHYQFYWSGYSPSSFYTESDWIVTSYN